MSDSQSEISDKKRIERLEARVTYLERKLGMNSAQSKALSEEQHQPLHKKESTGVSRNTSRTELKTEKSQWSYYSKSFSEHWLYWLGIGMLLLGVLFLFRFSIEQGWLIPQVRSFFGLMTGVALLTLGFNSGIGSGIRQFLLGGGVGVFYITCFSTFQLYTFVPYEVAFGFMVAVTILSFSLSVQQNSSILSAIGTLGGLATPFLLYRSEGSLELLIIYTSVVMTGAASIYAIRKWGSLLWCMAVGNGLVLATALTVNVLDSDQVVHSDRWVLQVSVIYMLALVWILPVVMEMRAVVKSASESYDENSHIKVMAVVMPLLALFFSYLLWDLSTNTLGLIALTFTLLTGLLYYPLKKSGLKELPYTHLFSSLILFTLSLFLFFSGNILLTVLALEAVALRYVASDKRSDLLSKCSHLLFGFVWVMMLLLFFQLHTDRVPLVNPEALSELFVILATGLLVPIISGRKSVSKFYQLIAHFGMLAWLLKELAPLDHGQVLTSIGWGIYALLVLAAGFRYNQKSIRIVGVATVAIFVFKLFLVDLSQTSALLRIPLFMGFGALFLLIGYLIQRIWGGQVNPGSDEQGTGFEKEST